MLDQPLNPGALRAPSTPLFGRADGLPAGWAVSRAPVAYPDAVAAMEARAEAIAKGEAGEKGARVLDAEVVCEELRGAVVGGDAFVENKHGVIQVDVLKAVGDGEDEPVVLARKAVQQANDVILGLRIQTAGDLVAEENLGLAREFHCEREAAALTA